MHATKFALLLVLMKTLVANIEAGHLKCECNDSLQLVRACMNRFTRRQDTLGKILHDTLFHAENYLKKGQPGAESNWLYDLQERPLTRDIVEAKARLPRILGQQSFLLVVDTIESYQSYEPAVRAGFSGFSDAITRLSADPDLKNIGLRMFVPTEVFEDIKFESPQKARNLSVFLQWSSYDLLKFVTIRHLDMLKDNEQLVDSRVLAECGDLVHRISYHRKTREFPLRRSFSATGTRTASCQQ